MAATPSGVTMLSIMRSVSAGTSIAPSAAKGLSLRLAGNRSGRGPARQRDP